MDTLLLKVPMLGQFFKNLAVLQFIEVLGNLMDAGFTIVEALKASTRAVGNRAIRKSIEEMHEAVTRGERFSKELARHGDLFPPVVNQLVVVGEKTGTLAKTTVHIREHLRREVETYTNVMVGTIEPVTTLGLASAIGCILLAIYLPMFDMINAMNARRRLKAHMSRQDFTVSRGRQGLSLLEMMAVVTLLGILAAIIIPRVSTPGRRAKTTSCLVTKSNIEIQAALWFRQTGTWPAANLADIGSDGDYFPEGLPTCPVDGSAYTFDSLTRQVVGHTH